ncbi:MAG: flagellar biosynthetic protein FliO [Gemmataceae bacterium]|nr:flagellar biosynthetic protein FliO [Gemmataceae bacterium]
MATPAPPPARRVPPLLVGAGLLVIAGGFGLPRVLPEPAPATPADPASKAAPAPPADGPGLGASLGRLAVSLVVVCGLCVGVARLVAKKPTAPQKGMTIAAALTVDPRCSVYLVTAGDRRLLLGVDPAGVKAVLELPGPPPEPAPRPEAAAEPVVLGPVRVAAPAIPGDIAAVLDRLRQQPATARQ